MVMDATIELKNKVLKYIESADDKLLRMISALAESYSEGEKTVPTVPDWFYEKLHEDREKHLRGETASYTWDEVKDRIRKQYDL